MSHIYRRKGRGRRYYDSLKKTLINYDLGNESNISYSWTTIVAINWALE